MKEPIIELTDVQLKTDRGGYVFQNLNLVLQPGRSAVIIGSSGSGKTLLTELLIGLRFAEKGSVYLFGMPMRRRRRVIRRVRRKIGGIGEPFGLIPSFTVAENITFPLVIAGARRKLQRERLLKALSEFSLLKLAGKYPRHLTRVENSLVQFARATVANQPLVIIDEPSAGLDHKTYERVHESLVRVALSGRSMLILSSQELGASIPESDFYRLVGGVLE